MVYCDETVYRMIEDWDKRNFWRKESDCFRERDYTKGEDYDYDCEFDDEDFPEGNDGSSPVAPLPSGGQG